MDTFIGGLYRGRDCQYGQDALGDPLTYICKHGGSPEWVELFVWYSSTLRALGDPLTRACKHEGSPVHPQSRAALRAARLCITSSTNAGKRRLCKHPPHPNLIRTWTGLFVSERSAVETCPPDWRAVASCVAWRSFHRMVFDGVVARERARRRHALGDPSMFICRHGGSPTSFAVSGGSELIPDPGPFEDNGERDTSPMHPPLWRAAQGALVCAAIAPQSSEGARLSAPWSGFEFPTSVSHLLQ